MVSSPAARGSDLLQNPTLPRSAVDAGHLSRRSHLRLPPLHPRRDRSSVAMPASPPKSQNSPSPATAVAPAECHLLPDAEDLATQLRNMCDHLNRFVRKRMAKKDGQETNYALRKRVTRTFLRRRSN